MQCKKATKNVENMDFLKRPGKNLYELHLANALLFQSDFLRDLKISIKSVSSHCAVEFYYSKIFETKFSASKRQSKLLKSKTFSNVFLWNKHYCKLIQTHRERLNAI